MFLVDANVVLYAHDADAAHHARARRWLEDAIGSQRPVGLPWSVIVAFLRIATHRRVWQLPMSVDEALAAVRNLLDARSVFIAAPTEAHWDTLEATVRQGQASGSLLPDAHLAAMAVEHGATLVTFDRDFGRFPALKLLNLLDETEP